MWIELIKSRAEQAKSTGRDPKRPIWRLEDRSNVIARQAGWVGSIVPKADSFPGDRVETI